MLTGIDHIVIVVPDLEATTRSYERLGFTVVRGGRHPVGTYNALISLVDGSYIELIAFYEANPKHRWWIPLQKGGGLVDFCMQTDDLMRDTREFRNAGVNIDDPQLLTRARPDGYQLKWVLSIPREGHRGVAPFLIQDETPREERIPREMTHKNGATGIGTVTVAVDELQSVRHWYKIVLGYDGKMMERDNLQAAGVSFKIGHHFFDFLKPLTPQSPLADWLKEHGPSPYAATLRSNSQRATALDKNLTHGALLSFE
jgi:catechol 2,3-dioxygenase-like lactoylglutathione lyase family enzyme